MLRIPLNSEYRFGSYTCDDVIIYPYIWCNYAHATLKIDEPSIKIAVLVLDQSKGSLRRYTSTFTAIMTITDINDILVQFMHILWWRHHQFCPVVKKSQGRKTKTIKMGIKIQRSETMDYSWFKDMPEDFKTQKMCNRVVEIGSTWFFDFVPEQFRTRVLCVKVEERNIHHFDTIKDEFKTREMCERVVEVGHGWLLDFLPDWFVWNRQ